MGWRRLEGWKSCDAVPFHTDATLGHPRIHRVAPAQVVRSLLVGGKGLGAVVNLIEVKAVLVVDVLTDVELTAARLAARVLGIVAAGGDERGAVLGKDLDGDGDEVHGWR